MLLISLLLLSLSSTLFAIPYGIQYDSVATDDLESKGCLLCYQAAYLEKTSSDNILSCAGPVLFVGAAYTPFNRETIVYLGAFALAEEVHKITELNTSHESNGVYWYFTPGKSFGFLKDTDLHQEPTADIGDKNPDSRLSWNLDNGEGGYRTGIYTFTYHQRGGFRKIIYNCPLSI